MSAQLQPLPAAAARTQAIAQLLDHSAAGTFIPFRGAYKELSVVRVPAELLAYRLDNGRIFFELEPALKTVGLDRSTARIEQDGPRVQQLLHALLVEKAADRRGAILTELARHGQQTEPLLISADGIVVNGNRRLAAMRELLAQDPAKFAGFAQIAVAVLPSDASRADLEYIEAALQMAPEVKLAYAWINRRLKLRWQRDGLKLPFGEISEAYRLTGEDQLERELGELALAEDYLAHFGDEGRYDTIQMAEPLFVGLFGELKNLSEPLRELWRLGGFTIIRARDKLEVGFAAEYPFRTPTPADVPSAALRGFAVEQGIIPDADTPILTAGAPATDDLRAALARREGCEVRAAALVAAVETVRVQRRERAAPQRVLKRLREAREMLEGLERSHFSREQQRRLSSEFAALQQQMAEVLKDQETKPDEKRTTAGDLRDVAARALRSLRG